MLLLPILGGGGKYTIFFKKKKMRFLAFFVFDGSQQLLEWLLRCVRVACY